jgi:hypothetical protein
LLFRVLEACLVTKAPKKAHRKPRRRVEPPREEREGATEREVGDRTGPAAGYDNEPEQERDRGGVS